MFRYYIIQRLITPLLPTQFPRTICSDNWYTGLATAEAYFQQGFYFVGTVRKSRTFVPSLYKEWRSARYVHLFLVFAKTRRWSHINQKKADLSSFSAPTRVFKQIVLPTTIKWDRRPSCYTYNKMKEAADTVDKLKKRLFGSESVATMAFDATVVCHDEYSRNQY